MKARMEMAAQKRQRLLAESAARRTDLGLHLHPVMHSLESGRVALRIAGRFGRHPEWIAAACLGMMVLKPHRLSVLLQAGTGGLRTWRMIGPVLQSLLMRR